MKIENYDDSELVILLMNDSIKAFDKLYVKYHLALFKNINKLLKDVEESENVLQEVFITLWNNRQTLDPLRPVANWLFVISYNLAKNQFKKSTRHTFLCDKLAIEHQVIEEDNNFLRECQLQTIEKAFNLLSPQKRKVFELCKMQGNTYNEAAEKLNISKHTVKEYLSDAVKSIKDYVEQHPYDAMHFVYIFFLYETLN